MDTSQMSGHNTSARSASGQQTTSRRQKSKSLSMSGATPETGTEGAEEKFGFLFSPAEFAAGPTPLHRKVARTRSWYDWTIAHSGVRSDLVERGFAWLEEHWPADPGPAQVAGCVHAQRYRR